MIIELKSVGCGIDSETSIVYPKNRDNTYDMEDGINIMYIDNDLWWNTLSDDDREIVSNFLLKD